MPTAQCRVLSTLPIPSERLPASSTQATVLYRVVARHQRTFLAIIDQSDGRGLPRFVRRELAALLDCGILAKGFARVRCTRCGDDLLVAFS